MTREEMQANQEATSRALALAETAYYQSGCRVNILDRSTNLASTRWPMPEGGTE